jgi:putative transcriptional regulator
MEGERISLEMREGLLYANRKQGISATGIAIFSAKAGEDVGISDLKGLISLEEGKVTVCKVPRVQLGGSRRVNLQALNSLLHEEKTVGCLGIEALVALRKVGREPDVLFGAKESAVESAFHGVSSIVVSVDEQIPSLLNRLESEGLKYELIDLTQE